MCMKCFLSILRLWLFSGVMALVSCARLGDDVNSGNGQLGIFFSDGSELLTKSFPNIPDTNDFHLKVTRSSGECVYEGAYGGCPEKLDLSPGSYVVSITSSQSLKPAFDSPVFGDEQCVLVKSGELTVVKLVCTQVNAGVRLAVSSGFKSAYTDAVLFLKSSGGSLMYSYAEKRYAYFQPGSISLLLSQGAEDNVLMVRELNPSEMLSVKVDAPKASAGVGCGLSVFVDTSRIWINDDCTAGKDMPADQVGDALTVADARKAVGQEDVWVSGYIVGGDLTSSSASFKVPFKSMTNILLGPRASVADKSACISVQLPDNEVREALNLVEYPGNLGRRVCVKGDIVASYYGICGMKNTVEYVLY